MLSLAHCAGNWFSTPVNTRVEGKKSLWLVITELRLEGGVGGIQAIK